MKTEEVPLYKSVSTYIRDNLFGCQFVGITDDGEVFMYVAHNSEEATALVTENLLRAFKPSVKKVTIVETIDVKMAEELIKELNSLIEGLETKTNPKLLQIEGLDESKSS